MIIIVCLLASIITPPPSAMKVLLKRALSTPETWLIILTCKTLELQHLLFFQLPVCALTLIINAYFIATVYMDKSLHSLDYFLITFQAITDLILSGILNFFSISTQYCHCSSGVLWTQWVLYDI